MGKRSTLTKPTHFVVNFLTVNWREDHKGRFESGTGVSPTKTVLMTTNGFLGCGSSDSGLLAVVGSILTRGVVEDIR